MRIHLKHKKLLLEYAKIVLRSFVLFGLVWLILLPFFYQLSHAVRGYADATNPLVIWIPETYILHKFEQAFQRLNYFPIFIQTLRFSLLLSALQVILSAMAGYTFAKLRFPGSNIMFYFVMFTLIIPYETLYVSRMVFFTNTPFFGISLIGNALALPIMTLFGMGIRSPILIYLFKVSFHSLPTELEQAAIIDGASIVRCFFGLMLPARKNTVLAVFILSFVWQWNDWYYMHFFHYATIGIRTFPTQLTSGVFRNASIEAANFLVMLPLIVSYVLIQHWWFKDNDLSSEVFV